MGIVRCSTAKIDTSMDKALLQFKQTLKQLDQEFLLYSPLPAAKVHCEFVGIFEGREVIWDSQIIALKHDSYPPADYNSRDKKSYIEVVSAQNISNQKLEHKLFVGLPINLITASAIRKTRIMILNYKRLRHGWHDFGEFN